MEFEFPMDPENLPEDMPEEVKHAIRVQHAAQQHHQMQSDQAAHDVVTLIKKLDEHDLMLLRGLVNALAMGDSTTHGYYFGLMSVELEKFGICLACGKKHDDQLQELLSEGQASIAENISKISDEEHTATGTAACTICGRNNDNGTHAALELGGHISHPYTTSWIARLSDKDEIDKINASEDGWATFIRSLRREDIKLLNDYHVQPVRKQFPKVHCIGCGTVYRSLKERMEHPQGQEGCYNCNHKEKWG